METEPEAWKWIASWLLVLVMGTLVPRRSMTLPGSCATDGAGDGVNGKEDDAMGMFLAAMVLLAVMGADGSEAREAARLAERAALLEQIRATLPNCGGKRGGSAPAFPESSPVRGVLSGP